MGSRGGCNTFQIWGVGMARGVRVGVEVQREFWRLRLAGLNASTAARQVGVSQSLGSLWVVQAGGVPLRDVNREQSKRFLSLEERTQIGMLRATGMSMRAIAAQLGRSPSTISRELSRNTVSNTRGYQPWRAHHLAHKRALRPKPRKLADDGLLRTVVQGMLRQRLSPEQISGRLKRLFSDDERMRASPETIYQAIYVQGRGSLRRDLDVALRTGRAVRRPKRRADERRSGIKDKVLISQRPAEVDDRAVPGHWEGDLILGAYGKSAIGTLVERSTRYVMLLHLPHDHTSASVRDEMIRAIESMPEELRKTVTWDQGSEMARHLEITMATNMAVYFCDPHSPWQRGSNENTNGLLRQYFPKGTNLSTHTRSDLDFVAREMNARPRKTLDFQTPEERLSELLSNPPERPAVATTA